MENDTLEILTSPSNQGGSRELNIGGALCSDDDVIMTSLLTATPKYWWGNCPTCPTTDYLPGTQYTLITTNAGCMYMVFCALLWE